MIFRDRRKPMQLHSVDLKILRYYTPYKLNFTLLASNSSKCLILKLSISTGLERKLSRVGSSKSTFGLNFHSWRGDTGLNLAVRSYFPSPVPFHEKRPVALRQQNQHQSDRPSRIKRF